MTLAGIVARDLREIVNTKWSAVVCPAPEIDSVIFKDAAPMVAIQCTLIEFLESTALDRGPRALCHSNTHIVEA